MVGWLAEVNRVVAALTRKAGGTEVSPPRIRLSNRLAHSGAVTSPGAVLPPRLTSFLLLDEVIGVPVFPGRGRYWLVHRD